MEVMGNKLKTRVRRTGLSFIHISEHRAHQYGRVVVCSPIRFAMKQPSKHQVAGDARLCKE